MSLPAQRRKARHYAMQAVYQWQLNQIDPNEIGKQFKSEYDMSHVDVGYFDELLLNSISKGQELDKVYEPYLIDRTISELDAITVSLLRIASYEFLNRIDVPFKVVISEAVSLAKKFGAADSHKFINAVLDRAAETLRATEVGSQ